MSSGLLFCSDCKFRGQLINFGLKAYHFLDKAYTMCAYEPRGVFHDKRKVSKSCGSVKFSSGSLGFPKRRKLIKIIHS